MNAWRGWMPAAMGCATALATMTAPVRAQDHVPQERVATEPALRRDSRSLDELLAREVTIDVTRVPLKRAIDALAESAKIPVQYEWHVVDAYSTPVTAHFTKVSLRTALAHVLAGTSLVVMADGPKRLAIVDGRAEAGDVQRAGIVTGTVTSTRTRRPVPSAAVWLDDSTHGTRTDASGRYQFANVTPGTHRVIVRALGFARLTRVVTVIDNQRAVADVALESSVNTLDQVVVTATGEQRIRELGHVVSRINVDSLVKEAPVTNLGELLTARVPGLQVLTGNGGVVGGDVALRLRGQTTTSLDPQPVVIVDGVRYGENNLIDIGNGVVGERARNFGAEARSPLNDLNVNDIESIEVVKGPSASTLYGPDAANGVIVITTKRGKAGRTEWHAYTAPQLTSEPSTSATSASGYRAWGHRPGTDVTVGFNCTLPLQANPGAQCVLDSITALPTINNTSTFGIFAAQRPQWYSGVSVSGGTSALTYFFSGNYDTETGALRLSPAMAQVLESQLGVPTLSDAIKNPNTQQTLTLHSNVSSSLTSTSTIGFVGSYTQATQRAVNIPAIYQNLASDGPVPTDLDTTDLSQLASYLPVNAFLQSTQMQLHRLTAAGNIGWRPRAWLTGTASIGTDLSSSIDRGVEPAGAEGADFAGYVTDDRVENTGRSASVGATAVARHGVISFRTALGGQYSYQHLDAIATQGFGLAPGSTSISTASAIGSTQDWIERAALGTYAEEVVGVNDRLFLTGSLRLDGSTTFGDAYKARPFPKMGASWIVSDEPFMHRLHLPALTELRLRSSFGVSSRYPTSRMQNGLISATNVIIDDASQNIFQRSLLANTRIGPERTREFEYGVDATLLSVANVSLAWYTRRTNDQLDQLTVPTGFLAQWANVGNLAAHGFEATVDVKLIQSRSISLGVNATYAYATNKLLSLGSATGVTGVDGSIVVGYPLGASFGRTIDSVTDLNDDGIIKNASEVVLTPEHYLGTFFAPNVYTLTPTVTMFDARVRVSALVDWQRGGVQRDVFSPGCGRLGLCVAQYLTSTPLLEQAILLGVTPGTSIVSSNFTRWRELSVTADVPSTFLAPIRLSRASVSAQVRNLALWTSFKGPDPESVPGLGLSGASYAPRGAIGIPQARGWTLRCDVYP